MKNKLTIKDIAIALNTTAATISRALNDHPRISVETKTRVLEFAERHHFRLNKVASSLRSGQTKLLGIMIPSAEINFFGSVVHGIESMANTEGYNVLICQTNETMEYEKKGIETFLSARVEGILVSLAKDSKDFDHFEKIKHLGIPIVFFDRYNEKLGMSSVVIDDFKGAYIATEHLLQQGYREIAHISGPLQINAFYERLLGYKQALKDYKINIKESMIYAGDLTIDEAKRGTKKIYSSNKQIDAFFAVEDFTALGIIKELKSMGKKIPHEVGVIGFANEKFDEHLSPSLSSIDQQTVKMGQEAFKLIMEQVQSLKTNSTMQIKNVKLEPMPFFRESSTRLK